MNVDFGSSHIETLADLIKIAEKHNCKITFGFDSHHETDIDEDILKKCGFTDEDLAFIRNNMNIYSCDSTLDRIWFELYDENNKTYNNMIYIESSTYFVVGEDGCSIEYPSYELTTKLEEHDEMTEIGVYTILESYNPTIIHGFGNKEKVEDYRVYRSGMALKFFGDLVCDYLNEPRIQRTY